MLEARLHFVGFSDLHRTSQSVYTITYYILLAIVILFSSVHINMHVVIVVCA